MLYPILFHRYQVHDGAELLEAGQECKEDEHARFAAMSQSNMDSEEVEGNAGSCHDESLHHFADQLAPRKYRKGNDIPIDTLITCKRLPVSMYCPMPGAKMMAERPRVNAYTDIGSKVPGKTGAREDCCQIEHGTEFKDTRVPCRQEVRQVEPACNANGY